ncbi:hypothetical protein L6452_19515 [Arctium lappa]|uniref:Uncharacterized protein n=1 Tax=Arctium lappa TaxID=4217 RepID=A0ACB9BA34_ARCLA|nr:hypothetical protein L6452_19515 [Arctium lappa]
MLRQFPFSGSCKIGSTAANSNMKKTQQQGGEGRPFILEFVKKIQQQLDRERVSMKSDERIGSTAANSNMKKTQQQGGEGRPFILEFVKKIQQQLDRERVSMKSDERV